VIDAIDLFAGPGGWDLAAQRLGINVIGVELDDAAVATRKAAGLATWQGDVAAVTGLERRRGKVAGLIASPPCPSFSAAGKGLGRKDMPHIVDCMNAFAQSRDERNTLRERCMDERSALTVEPLRWALEMQPAWLAWEQVPAVLPLWEKAARVLRYHGWYVAVAKLHAEEYGVPQTRQRAILIAHRERPVSMPEPTHQRYRKGKNHVNGVPMPVTMAQALGWGMTERPGMSVTGGGTDTGGAEPFGNGARKGIAREGRWRLRSGQSIAGVGRAERESDQPSVTVGGRFDLCKWTHERPSTTVACDPRISGPGHKGSGDERDPAPRQQANAIRVTEQEAAVLQSFPADYPWQGTRTKRFQQIGNAIPPVLAEAILRSVLHMERPTFPSREPETEED
jgi:DNA (cytosine-5)-methyltransferase 1